MAPTTLLLLHGFTNTGASWEGVQAALVNATDPLAPDIRGHGRAGAVRPVSLEGVIDDVTRWRRGDSSWPATRWAGGWRCTSPWPCPAGHPAGPVGASPGLATADARAARRAADERLADELETDHRAVRGSLGADADARRPAGRR